MRSTGYTDANWDTLTDAVCTQDKDYGCNRCSQIGTVTTAVGEDGAAGYTGQGSGRVPCAAGTFKAETNSAAACTSCPDNTGSAAASVAESDCKADAGFTGSGSGVAACAAGKFKAEAVTSVTSLLYSNYPNLQVVNGGPAQSGTS